MDMIYADANFVDQGILQDYSFDMEYGVGDDTNTFQCKIQRYNPAMNSDKALTQDFILYVENSEYGGIVDRIESDTKSGVITLSGRTWHGVLNSFVIEPPNGQAYRVYNGTVQEVFTQMLQDTGLQNFFVVDADPDNAIHVHNFEVRYENLYDAMIRMLDRYNGKFKCYYKLNKVHIFGVLACNYAVCEEFDSSQVPFKVGLTYNNINHMICLGQGDGEKRAVIHLFTDDSGKIQPYTTTSTPISDSDYILDKRNQVMTGIEERCYVYDYPNAEITYNYPPLQEAPPDWKDTYFNYYKKAEHGYQLIEREYADRLRLLEKEPYDWSIAEGYKNYYTVNADCTQSTPVTTLQEDDPDCRISYVPEGGQIGAFADWSTNYKNYFEYDSISNEYQSVGSRRLEKKDNEVTERPIDWTWNYSSYNTRTWNGIEWEYTTVAGVSTTEKVVQTAQPNDWETDWGNYWTKATKQKKEHNKIIYKKGDYITVDEAVSRKMLKKKKGKDFPEWKENTFYNEVTNTVAPEFTPPVYYSTFTEVAPVWTDNRYYKRIVRNTPRFKRADPDNGFYGYWELIRNEEQIPEFVAGTYYYETFDRYKVMIEDAKEKLAELTNTSSLRIDLELTDNYDVGDIVGSIDTVTGIKVNKPILRKIIQIKKDIVTISHEVE